MDKWERLAHHEAGHVVVGHALRLEVNGATIVPDGTNEGLADIPGNLELLYGDEGDQYAKAQLTCYVAGAVAEEILTGKEVQFEPGDAYGDDWSGAVFCVDQLPGGDEKSETPFERAWADAKRILQERWDTVARLADALLAHETLDRQQVAELLKGEE